MSGKEVEELLAATAAGSVEARNCLLARYREPLKRVIRFRMDPRISARVGSSDVVQEVLTTADQGLDEYLRTRPADFYVWIRGIAEQRLMDLHRRHITAAKRTVRRELATTNPMPEDSSVAQDFPATDQTSPSQHLIRGEQVALLQEALLRLNDDDREVIGLRYLEHLTMPEVAEILGISLPAAKSRHLRALARLTALVKEQTSSNS